MTDEGIFFISNISKELYDICDTFSNSNNKKLIKFYKNYLNDISNNEISMRELNNNLSNVINNLLIAAANIFGIIIIKIIHQVILIYIIKIKKWTIIYIRSGTIW